MNSKGSSELRKNATLDYGSLNPTQEIFQSKLVCPPNTSFIGVVIVLLIDFSGVSRLQKSTL